MKILFDAVPLVRIINVDETAIFIAPKNLKIWHSKGKDDVIIPVKFNEKDRITAVCGVDANGPKLNIQFIPKGETDIVLGSQIGDVSPHMRAYSKKGWTTIETFYDYLNYIKSLFPGDDEIHVILNVFSAHKSEEIQEYVKDLSIVLHFIPSGLTDLYQHLDVKLFAIVKAYLKHIVRQFLREDRIITRKLASQFIVRAWEKLSIYFILIQESFEFLTIEDRWRGNGQNDLSIMHTCRYNSAKPVDKKSQLPNYTGKGYFKIEYFENF